MDMNGKKALGVLLVLVGGVIILNFLGIHLGGLIKLFMPIILIFLGAVGWYNNKKMLGGILIAIGAIMLLGKLSGLLVLLLAIGIVVWGVSLFKGDRSYRGMHK